MYIIPATYFYREKIIVKNIIPELNGLEEY